MSTKYHGTACKTCRRRGRKCTKELPTCQTCVRKGIPCEGYVFRWAGLASRGKLAGKTLPSEALPAESSRVVSSQPSRKSTRTASIASSTTTLSTSSESTSTVSSAQSYQYQSTAATSISGADDITSQPTGQIGPPILWRATLYDRLTSPVLEPIVQRADTKHLLTSSGGDHTNDSSDNEPPPILDLSAISGLKDPYNVPAELKFILNYHVKEVARRLCVDNDNQRNPYTQYMLPLAVEKPALLYACAALAACHFNVRLNERSYLVDCYRFRGKAMRRLQEQLWTDSSAQDEGNLATVLMLTLTDMCLGGYSNFDAHFAAARRLIDLRGTQRTQDAFVEQYIAWLDIMSAASNLRKPRFTSKDILMLTGPTRGWSHDVFPCPPDQFAIISEAVEIHKSLQTPGVLSEEQMARVRACKAQALTGAQHLDRGTEWFHLTEAYKHAIALFIIRLFRLHADEDEVEWLAQTVFIHARATPSQTGWSDQMLWPLFHAGLEIRDQRRQQWLRDRSIDMQRSGGFANVDTAMKILERVWASEDPPDYLSLLKEGTNDMLVV